MSISTILRPWSNFVRPTDKLEEKDATVGLFAAANKYMIGALVVQCCQALIMTTQT
jgi:hypothetical protein